MTLWGGRFDGKLDENAWNLNTSLPVDKRMALQDVSGSLAWAASLNTAGVISLDEHRQISAGLETIRSEFQSNTFQFQISDEDIHTAVERRLRELIGAAAGKLHTGRSRNDQVATDFRLWIMDQIPLLLRSLHQLQETLVILAEKGADTPMPGYTHLQRAQPVLLAHWWLSHFWPLQRDTVRFAEILSHTATMPLGSGALAGTAIDIDRLPLSRSLGFQEPSQNSMDAVSDRDFAAEFLFAASLCGVHLSKLSEQVVLFTSSEFHFLELSDQYSTGSSLMPQKKNPDIFELTRGKAATLIGLLTGLMAALKGLPSTYDKDLQEDKSAVFSAADTLAAILPVLSGALSTIRVHQDNMLSAIDSFMMATDLADYLVGKGIPFRETHALAGKAVKMALDKGVGLDTLTLEDYQQLHPSFDQDVYRSLDPINSINRRNAIGGTSIAAVTNQIQAAKLALKGEK